MAVLFLLYQHVQLMATGILKTPETRPSLVTTEIWVSTRGSNPVDVAMCLSRVTTFPTKWLVEPSFCGFHGFQWSFS